MVDLVVAVAGVALDVREHPGLDGRRQPGQVILHRVVAAEAEPVRDLLEGHPVVARIGVPGAVAHRHLGQVLAHLVDDHPLGELLAGVADVEHLAPDPLLGCGEHGQHRLGDVRDVAVGPPGVGVVDLQRAAGGQLPGELRDGQVEAHPRGQPVGGGDPQHGRGRAQLARPGQQVLLHRDLGPGVERLRVELAALVGQPGRVVDAVVAAGGGEHEAADAELVEPVDDGLRARLVDRAGQLRVALADRVTDQRGQ